MKVAIGQDSHKLNYGNNKKLILGGNENYKVKILEGDYTNIKITTSGDLNIIREFIG